jgi:hypothetical protein
LLWLAPATSKIAQDYEDPGGGGGGREHALVWKLRQSPRVEHIYCAPGNAGIDELAEAVDLDVADLGRSCASRASAPSISPSPDPSCR